MASGAADEYCVTGLKEPVHMLTCGANALVATIVK